MSLLQRSVAGGVLILVIVLLRGLLGRRLPRRTFTALWLAASLRLLLPLPLPSPLSVYNLFSAPRQSAPAPVTPGIPVRLLPAAGAAAVPAEAAAGFSGWAAVYWAVSAGLGLWFLLAYLRWRRRFAASLPAPEGTGWRHPRVALRVSDQIAAPLSYGLLRPVILLPKSMDWTDEAALRCVLAHEYAHIRHLDGVAKLLFAAALCRFWFHPAVWLLYALGSRDLELACDEAAVRSLGRPGDYARALLRMEERRSHPLYNHFSQHAIEERIEAIMTIKQKKLSLTALILALLLAVCVTTAFATSAEETPPPAEPGREAPAEADVSTPAQLLLPVSSARLSAGFSSRTVYTYPEEGEEGEPAEQTLFHSGIDLAAERGTAVLAALDGTVESAGYDAKWGNYLLLDHGNGLKTLYAHCADVTASAGDAVSQGDTIATLGSSGMSTGPHLHFEVRQDGLAVDPMAFLQ